VSVPGTNLSSPVDGTGKFTLDGVPPGDIQIKITGSGVDAAITVSGVQAGQTITLKITVSGNAGVIDSDSREGSTTDPNRRELEGRIETNMSGTSSLMVSGQLVTATTSGSSATVIRKGDTLMLFSELQVGMRVHVKGTMIQTIAPPSLAATEIIVQNENTDVPMKVEGVVAATPPSTGSCSTSNLTFVLEGKAITVMTDSRTSFKPSCLDVKAGATVEVMGRLQSASSPADEATPNTILAEKVDVTKAAPEEPVASTPELEYKGAMSGLSGSCPAISFFVGVGSPQISAGSSTSFKPSCSALRNGDNVEVKAIESEGRILATKVERK
jgi:hypothetical protein